MRSPRSSSGKSEKLKMAKPTLKQALSRNPPVPVDVERGQVQVAELQTRIDQLNSLVDTLRKRSKEEGRAILQAAIDKYGIEPVDELLRMAIERDAYGEYTLPHNTRAKILLELAEFRIPKIKQQEVRVDHDHHFVVKIQKFGDPTAEAIDVTPKESDSALK
jgi:pimeloyl-CoA synthetase